MLVDSFCQENQGEEKNLMSVSSCLGIFNTRSLKHVNVGPDPRDTILSPVCHPDWNVKEINAPRLGQNPCLV